ncbi:nicotinate-nucleotide pyrophosphorylase [carboxylating] [Peptoclostridium litorale DSM 5388]|uniref:Probable nicotinate-nucleotide pyrophosphorylase [carboxylating] n=1 Tax=Peptoclostridium litorale DSM 5388 TaxID=1121324 RepID=A0A069RBU2_PEPLI|nr:carboxylating nicotinate-nucleotide diphosphorylase [Peptoclostridium litorale]KDR94511.1 putative nicotinate-nucleotide pyrophosphorylase [Peptoclostridium litorale DSM 5388]SIO35344.1 nicotinate-nucleotide pyrophosphorylase [carboxylating] [Peptoclostridium litorale DSM 5388]
MQILNKIQLDEFIKDALMEDINYYDITTDNLIDEADISSARFICKEDGVLCGIEIARRVFEILDDEIEFTSFKSDSQRVCKGDVLATVGGKTRTLLKGERTALNIIQRLSGIASKTRRMSDILGESRARVVDTRKTTPNMRFLEKYAVKCGGGYNHRYNLSHSVMIKDNHIKACGGIKNAVEKIRSSIGHTEKIEVEVKDEKELVQAIESNVDIVMLDNMGPDKVKGCVAICRKMDERVVIEVSGNIDEGNIGEYASTGVDVISVGALTHSFKSLDISMKL